MTWVCLGLMLLAMSICLPLCQWLIGMATRHGHLDRPGSEGHKRHTAAIPNVGGIAIFAGIVIPMLLAILAAWFAPQSLWQGILEPIGEHLPGLKRVTPAALGVLACLTVMHVTGVIDDRRGVGPLTKLAVQGGVALVLAALMDVRVLHYLDQYGPIGTAISYALTVLWIIVITNAMNMLDNMDGLSGGVGAIIAVLYLAATLIGGQWFIAGLAALLLGSLIGFLVFNFPPARVFMGDGGSLVVGMMLSIISIRTTYFDPAQTGNSPGTWYGVLMPVMVMAIPLYDFVSVTLVRMARGQSPLKGDHNHFSHRLVRKGLSRRAAVIVIWLCTLATGLSGVMLSRMVWWQALLAAGQTAAVLAVLALLEWAGSEPE